MKKGFMKIIAVFMVVIMAAVYMPVINSGSMFGIESSALTSNNNSLGNNVKWSYDTSSKVLTISGSGNMPDFSSTPSAFSSYNWKLVVTIANHATKIVVNSGVTSIGNYAFKDFGKVTSVTLPASVKSIGQSAFEGCTSLKSITIPASVKIIGQSAFEGCSSLSSVTLNEGLKTIGSYAFKNTKFASVRLPYSVTSVGDYAFANISGLNFTCAYNDVVYKYAVKYSSSYTLICEPVLAVTFDTDNMLVNVDCKVKRTSGLNAANFVLTYNDAVTLVGSDNYNVTEENGMTKAIVYNESGKISIAVATAGSLSVSEVALVSLTFKVNGQADAAQFTISSPYSAMLDSVKISVKDTSANINLHSYSEEITKTPTCCTVGEKIYTCALCGKSTTEEIAVDANNHSGKTEIKNATASTCTVKGYSGDTVCSDCGATVSSGTELALADHNYESKVVEPDCKNGGYTVYTCKDCGHSYTGDETAAGGHKYDTEVVAPDCTNSGYTIYTCSVCGVSYRGDNVASLGHDYGEDGKCTRCDDVLVTEISFGESTSFTVNNENHTVVSKLNNIKTASFVSMIDGEGWAVYDSEGNALADDAVVRTGCVIKHASGTAEYTLVLMGDVNFDGKVTAADARLALRVSAKMDTVTDIQTIAADVDFNSKITAADARLILRVSAKMQEF